MLLKRCALPMRAITPIDLSLDYGRAVYVATGQEQLRAINPVLPQADAGAPSPTAAMVEGSVVVAYDDRSGERVFARFVGVTSALFGAPNDEALDGHPLYERGLKFYEFVEVENSPWVSDLERTAFIQVTRPSRSLRTRRVRTRASG